MASQQRDMLRAIHDDPADDAPRRVYADWLLERGDPRGELIHLQCELATFGTRDPRRKKVLAREQALLRTHNATWGPFHDPRFAWAFERGFVSGFGHQGVFHHEGPNEAMWIRFFLDNTALFIVTGTGGSADVVAKWFVQGHGNSSTLAYTIEPTGKRVRVVTAGKKHAFTAELTARSLEVRLPRRKKPTTLLLAGTVADSRYS